MAYRVMLLLFSLLLPFFQPALAQPGSEGEAILYMAYEDTAEGIALLVSPSGYRAVEIGRDWFGADAFGRYQREEMVASEEGRWLAISVRDTVEDVILWVTVIALDQDGQGGNTLFPLPVTRAVKLGSFSPDGRWLALAVVGHESPDAPLTGGVMVFDTEGSPESDEPFTWWLPLEPRDGQVMWAEIGAWTAEGVQFLPTCYDCTDSPAGEYSVWNPFTETVTPATGVYFVPDAIPLAATGEALRLDYDADFPLAPGSSGANVIRYLPAVTPDAGEATTLYADARGIRWAAWVLDGQAVLAQPAGLHDAWVLIYRDGRVVAVPHALGIRFVTGSPEGWFIEAGNADGYTDIRHMNLDSTDNLVGASGGAIVVRPAALGASLPIPPPPFPPLTP